MSKRAMRVAIVYHGNEEERRKPESGSMRFQSVFDAFNSYGAVATPVVYNDRFCDEVKTQLLEVDAVLVWVNPIEDGCDRTKLDALLRELSTLGKYVSTHPGTILKLGTKEVLERTKALGWGSDVHLYSSLSQMRRELPARLLLGPRVLKQNRGQSGDGVWRIAFAESNDGIEGDSRVLARHAKSGSIEENISLDEFIERCGPYFHAVGGQGRMIDQEFQPRISEGMVRCYLVGGRVEGFGRQEIVALHPIPAGSPPTSYPKPTKRHYHPPTLPEFQRLKALLESEWVPATQEILGMRDEELPALWDCDFIFGPKDENGQDSYVLCEVNVSSVSPFPDSAVGPLVRHTLSKIS
ncbi:MAG: Cj0069 family protein [Bdellovibrionaceae bacterium]|nr:Cj0069 family protein [Pseudobdellovibrionaceae bacterium]